MRYPGGIIRATPVVPTTSSARGIWTLAEVMQAKAQGIWPIVGPGVPTSIGTVNTAGNTSSIVITTTAAILAGNLVVVAVQIPSNALRTVSSVSDGTNTYSLAKSLNDGANYAVELWYCANAAAVNPGASLTITLSGATTGSNGYAAQAFQVNGVALVSPLDVTSSQNATTASPTTTTATLAQSVEIAFGVSYRVVGTNTYTEASGFTNLDTTTTIGGSAGRAALAYRITAATTAVTYAPTWSGSAVTLTILATFKGA